MSLNKVLWREASTLIIVSPMVKISRTIKSDYEILMLKRSKKSSFMPENLVFPGGILSPADFDQTWRRLFENHTNTSLEEICMPFMMRKKPIFAFTDSEADETGNSAKIPRQLAFRIAAIRECFEECGFLLAQKSSSHSVAEKNTSNAAVVLTSKDLNAPNWRKRVHQDANAFVELCSSNDIVPDIWCLKEWANWLTPAAEGGTEASTKPKRFDTLFYVACLDTAHPVLPKADNREVTHAEWRSPAEWLDVYIQGKMMLAPPQVYEIARLCQFEKHRALEKFCTAREPEGLEHFYPHIVMCSDGIVTIYPGDDMYPEAPDYTGTQPFEPVDKTILELQESCRNLNRGCRPFSNKLWSAVCNIKPGCGHVAPVNMQNTVRGYL